MSLDVETKLRVSCCECGECVEWRSDAKSELRRRHPLIRMDGKNVLVRRVLWQRHYGKALTEDQFLTPRCKNRYCIKPEHQKVLSTQQKQLLGANTAAKSLTRGATIAKTKRAMGQTVINDEIADEIRNSDEAPKQIAARLGIHPKTVWNVRTGRNWRDYGNPFTALLQRKVA